MKYTLLILTSFFALFSCNNPSPQKDREVFNIEKKMQEMTLDEKVSMIHANGPFTTNGVPRLGIPQLEMSDGPHGVREEYHDSKWQKLCLDSDSATYFPVGIALAATWNKDLAGTFGKSLGAEARARGKDIILGPGVNINRTPVCGRNFEYLGEDPFLAKKMVVPVIQGIQSKDVAACVKHFVANNQEYRRNDINVQMDERALREIYLPAFKAAVQEADVYTLMSAYNKFRGQYCTHHEYLINDILKGEWGYEGVVLSDWNATHSTREAARYGLDLEMGTFLPFEGNKIYDKDFTDEYLYMARPYLEKLKKGEEDTTLLNDKVRRILRVMKKINMLDGERDQGAFTVPEHFDAALKTAEEAIVLLKNQHSLLPLDMNQLNSIGVIGEHARMKHAHEGGSSEIKSIYEITPYQGIKNKVGEKLEINYAPGSTEHNHQPQDKFLKNAIHVAKNSEVAVIFTGHTHSEDREAADKKSIQLPEIQENLIKAVAEANPNTIVVLTGGSGIDMREWIASIPSVLFTWYPGLEGGNAIANILFGDVNPSGKLPVTFPEKLEDIPAHSIGEYPEDGEGNVYYEEGIFVGYRHFDKNNVEPLFCFGHGLSYTQFDYSDIKATKQNDYVLVSATIKNTGDRQGKEVVQLYVKALESKISRPEKELKGFAKVDLKPGEDTTIEFKLKAEDFSYYSTEKEEWIVEPCEYELILGASSRDLRLRNKINLDLFEEFCHGQ